ncbi:hypothetical protein [Yoonia sp.]|uniref:hypothetical protein n=1 Tax=Yoonia sp. TaxID=2212373 RepID=UPI00358E0ED1
MSRYATALGLLFCLSACGGGGGGGGSGSGIDPRLARLDVYEAQKLRVLGDPGAGVMGMPVTADANMPTGGAMSFAGYGTIRVETGATPLVLFGDAGVQVDFDTNTATGAIENTFGTNARGDVVDYTGVVTLQAAVTTQDMPLTYDGALSAGDTTLDLSGTMTGVFLGNPTTALTAADLEAGILQNGTLRTATVVVTFEQTPPP